MPDRQTLEVIGVIGGGGGELYRDNGKKKTETIRMGLYRGLGSRVWIQSLG